MTVGRSAACTKVARLFVILRAARCLIARPRRADESDEFKGPEAVGGTPVSLMLYVEDVDKTFSKALSAGGTQLRPVVDQSYGDRSGTLREPFGHIWTVSTHKEDVSPEEMGRRMAAMPKMQ